MRGEAKRIIPGADGRANAIYLMLRGVGLGILPGKLRNKLRDGVAGGAMFHVKKPRL